MVRQMPSICFKISKTMVSGAQSNKDPIIYGVIAC